MQLIKEHGSPTVRMAAGEALVWVVNSGDALLKCVEECAMGSQGRGRVVQALQERLRLVEEVEFIPTLFRVLGVHVRKDRHRARFQVVLESYTLCLNLEGFDPASLAIQVINSLLEVWEILFSCAPSEEVKRWQVSLCWFVGEYSWRFSWLKTEDSRAVGEELAVRLLCLVQVGHWEVRLAAAKALARLTLTAPEPQRIFLFESIGDLLLDTDRLVGLEHHLMPALQIVHNVYKLMAHKEDASKLEDLIQGASLIFGGSLPEGFTFGF